MLDEAACWRVIAGRDRRFEGRFVVAVRTTRVYCRAGCPAPLPKRKNVCFFPCAAAAEEEGFRACRRCRPDASPRTPAWNGTSSTVTRALGLIHEGALDHGGVDDLAARLGVGDRHLRRLFLEHLGAPPVAIARTRRTHFARKLIEETGLPMTRIAEAAGFSSLRRFNDTMRETFDAPPSALRKSSPVAARGAQAKNKRARGRSTAIRGNADGAGSRRSGSARLAAAGEPAPTLRLRLPFRPPYDWKGLAEFFAPRVTPGIERVRDGRYARTISVDGEAGTIEIGSIGSIGSIDSIGTSSKPDDRHLELALFLPSTKGLMEIVERAGRFLDLHADPDRIAAHLGTDPALAPVFEKHPGLRVPGAWDPFEMSVRAILGQQVSVAAATTLAGRIVAAYGEPLPKDRCREGLTHLFPSSEKLARVNLSRIGLTKARASSIRELARRIAGKELSFEKTDGLDETVERLCALPGIGPWTAQYIAMRALGEPDAFPASDLGILRALGQKGRQPNPREVTRRAEAWRPWRAYAVMAIWKLG